MGTKFTPGPWVIDGDYIVQEGVDDVGVCEVLYMDVDDDSVNRWFRGPVTEANAQLICAAPDGLAAAIKALDECVDLIGTPAGDALEAFILKATGELP